MKLSTIAKVLPLAAAIGFCSTANAGVSATSYLELNNLSVEIDTDNDNVGDTVLITDYIAILGGTREGNANATFAGVADSDDSVTASPIATADAELVCVGPSCAGLALTNNGQSLDGGNLVATDAEDYAVADMEVTGNALGDSASGFTYGDVGITVPNATAVASSAIFNNLLTSVTIDVAQSINLRFTALYDMLVDAVISTDIRNDISKAATASAEASFSIEIKSGGTTIFEDGVSASDFAFDIPGTVDSVSINRDDEVFESTWVNLIQGQYQVTIAQDSDVQASLIPEPGALALFGMGLLGLGFSARRRANK